MKKEDYLRILEFNISDFVEQCACPEEEIILRQDKDLKHTANIVKDWLSVQKFQTMQWPKQSPGLNPIENLRALLKKKRLTQYDNPPTNFNKIWSRI